ncbi:uricase-like [Temnothorax longispinosus]|uniref:uricase-like n=1 Tax=Temnothorax longispinosus TaxID=300112 RepID=UPI003A9A449F
MSTLKEQLSHMPSDDKYSFSRPMRDRESARSARDVRVNISENDKRGEYELGACGYGKNNVKLLYVRRSDELRHEIREYEVDTHLRLSSQRDYLEGDNRDIIATDSQKNTVYLMAKKHGIHSPEAFALLLCSHFLYMYEQVAEVSINVEEYPWARYQVDNRPHNHAFIMCPTATRFCQVSQLRNESPRIRGGLKELRVLKTTQSSFTDFIQDEYRTLPDMNDRIFSTVVTATWDFSTATGVDFDRVWDMVKECIMQNFAGPPDTGIYSPSVQNTLYLTEKCILNKVKQIRSIEMQMPNKHYFDLDFSKFSKVIQGQNKEVYLPMDKPSGIIYARLNRKDFSPKL